jgi:hypothetical protein
MKMLDLFKRDELKLEHIKDVYMNDENLNPKNARHSFEFLKLINDAKGEEQVELLKKWGSIPPLNMLLSLNFDSRLRLVFPEGAPPYNRNEAVHPDMCTPLSGQILRLKGCVSFNNNPSEIKRSLDRERVLIQILEQISFKEADVLIACKDKLLQETYPNITAELVKSVFPNYVG